MQPQKPQPGKGQPGNGGPDPSGSPQSEKQPFVSTDLFATMVVASIWLLAFSITVIASFA